MVRGPHGEARPRVPTGALTPGGDGTFHPAVASTGGSPRPHWHLQRAAQRQSGGQSGRPGPLLSAGEPRFRGASSLRPAAGGGGGRRGRISCPALGLLRRLPLGRRGLWLEEGVRSPSSGERGWPASPPSLLSPLRVFSAREGSVSPSAAPPSTRERRTASRRHEVALLRTGVALVPVSRPKLKKPWVPGSVA